MSTPTKYTYSISADFPGSSVNSTKLKTEIQNSLITISLERIDTSEDVIDIWFRDVLSNADKTILDNNSVNPAGGLIAAHDNTPDASTIQPVSLTHQLTSDNRLRVAIEKSDASARDIYTHNWCDKTTWYQGSIRVVDEVAQDSGNHILYSLDHQFVIDTYHGKITQEDELVDANNNSYRVKVSINDVEKNEQDPHYGTGGDYVIDYEAGTISFLNALQDSDTIKVTYYYASSSLFIIKPAAGTTLTVETAEVQFSADVQILDTVVFQVHGYVDVFAPQLLNNPYPSGTLIPIRTFKYKTMNDYQNAAFKSYPTYPALGGNGWRGQQQEVVVFDWDYQRSLPLNSQYGMEIRLYLEHDAEFGGNYATATLYCGVV